MLSVPGLTLICVFYLLCLVLYCVLDHDNIYFLMCILLDFYCMSGIRYMHIPFCSFWTSFGLHLCLHPVIGAHTSFLFPVFGMQRPIRPLLSHPLYILSTASPIYTEHGHAPDDVSDDKMCRVEPVTCDMTCMLGRSSHFFWLEMPVVSFVCLLNTDKLRYISSLI